MDASYNEMDVNMFNQYMYKSDEDNLNVSLSVQGQQQQFTGPQQQQQQQHHQQPQPSIANQYSGTMSDHTFHTPSFGDEEFDIPDVLHHHASQALGQFPMHNIMSDQQPAQTFDQHQWTQASAVTSAGLTFQNHADFHHASMPGAGENMVMMQQQQTMQEPLMSAGFVEATPISGHENGSTSDESDDNALNDPNSAFKMLADEDAGKGAAKKTAVVAGKPMTAAAAAIIKGKKKKRDPNEPLKPVSAYALFFRDTQAAIKGQNPNASFGEVSKIVASMWDVLAPEHKNVYKKKQETAKKEYLKALAAYRAGNLQPSSEAAAVSQNQPPTVTAVVAPPVQNFTAQAQTMTAPTFPQQNFVSQPLINQAVVQQPPQQQAPVSQFDSNQQMQQQQQAYQQSPQQQQQPLQSITNNNNQMPPVATQPAHQNYEKCIRNGCLNPAVVSVDWEDEYCSNECVIQHCREVFGNFIQLNAANQQINFPVK